MLKLQSMWATWIDARRESFLRWRFSRQSIEQLTKDQLEAYETLNENQKLFARSLRDSRIAASSSLGTSLQAESDPSHD